MIDIHAVYALLGAGVIAFVVLKRNAFASRIQAYEKEYRELHWFIFRLVMAVCVYRFMPSVPPLKFLAPLSFLRFVPFIHPFLIDQAFQSGIRRSIAILLILFICDVKPKITILLMTMIYVTYAAASMSYGRIGNSTHLPSLLLLIWSSYYLLVDAKNRRPGHIFFLSYIVISVYYALACIAKYYTQPDFSWINADSLRLWIMSKAYDYYGYTGVLTLNIVQRLVLASPIVTFVSSAIAFGTEVSGGLVVFSRGHAVKLCIIAGLIGMHVVIAIAMDIYFLENILLLSGIFIIELLIVYRTAAMRRVRE